MSKVWINIIQGIVRSKRVFDITGSMVKILRTVIKQPGGGIGKKNMCIDIKVETIDEAIAKSDNVAK